MNQKRKEEVYLDITGKDKQNIIKTNEEEENNRIEIDPPIDYEQNTTKNIYIKRLEALENKMENIYNIIIPHIEKMDKTIKNIQTYLKDKLIINIQQNLDRLLNKNADIYSKILIDSLNLKKDKLQERIEIRQSENESEIRRFNFLFEADSKEDLKNTYNEFKQKKQILEMYLAENTNEPKIFYLLGKFKTQTRFDIPENKKIKFISDSRSYQKCYERYIQKNKILEKYP